MTSLKTKMSRTSLSSSYVEKQREDSVGFDDLGDRAEAGEESLEDTSSLCTLKGSGDNKILFMLGNFEDSKVMGDLDVNSVRINMLSAEHKVT